MTGQVVDEVLLVVPRAQLHKVEGGLQTLLVEGDFSVAITHDQPPPATASQPQQQSVQAAVGGVAWPLDKQLPALKAAANIYSFALPSSRAVYYCLILPPDTPQAVLEALHDVLHASSALSTVKQVDAAAEEVDKLQGGKEAAALAAAEAAGTAPDAAAAANAAAAAAPGRAELPSSGNPTADKVAAGLLWGGTAVAAAVGRAASATAGAIDGYSQRQQAAAQQQQQQAGQQQQATISPTFKRGLAVAAAIAASAAAVTGKLAELVGHASYAMALAIARALPGHKKKQPGDLVSPEERSALQTMGAAGLVAFVQVYDSLENAAQVVFASSTQATADYIAYKYGAEAGAAAADSVPVARDMLTATLNCSRLGARAIVSKTAKKTAKVYLKSTMAGLHPDDQAAGSRLPTLGCQPAAGSGGSMTASSAAAAAARQQQQQQMGRAGSAPAGLHSSSQALHNPYPQGSSAAAAAAAAAVGPARVGATPAGSRLGQQ